MAESGRMVDIILTIELMQLLQHCRNFHHKASLCAQHAEPLNQWQTNTLKMTYLAK